MAVQQCKHFLTLFHSRIASSKNLYSYPIFRIAIDLTELQPSSHFPWFLYCAVSSFQSSTFWACSLFYTKESEKETANDNGQRFYIQFNLKNKNNKNLLSTRSPNNSNLCGGGAGRKINALQPVLTVVVSLTCNRANQSKKCKINETELTVTADLRRMLFFC